jgi:hypothetical protein
LKIKSAQYVWLKLFEMRLIEILICVPLSAAFALCGAFGAIFYLLLALAPNSNLIGAISIIAGLCAGIYTTVRVRKKVKSRPKYVSNHPYGWWP